MSVLGDLAELRDKPLWIITLGVIGWLAFISQKALDSPSREEMRYAIEHDGPYLQDKQWIHASLVRVEEAIRNLQLQIKDNNKDAAVLGEERSKEVRQLRLDLERLLAVKPSDVMEKVGRIELLILEQMRLFRKDKTRDSGDEDINPMGY